MCRIIATAARRGWVAGERISRGGVAAMRFKARCSNRTSSSGFGSDASDAEGLPIFVPKAFNASFTASVDEELWGWAEERAEDALEFPGR